MLKKLKEKAFSLYSIICCQVVLFLGNMNLVFADVTFNQGKAISETKAILDPVANAIMVLGFGATIVSLGMSYFSWNGKSEEEKEQMPFLKTVKKHVMAYVAFGFAGTILKWFTIS